MQKHSKTDWTPYKARRMQGQPAVEPLPESRPPRDRHGTVVGVWGCTGAWSFSVIWDDEPGQLVFYFQEECQRQGKGAAAILEVQPMPLPRQRYSVDRDMSRRMRGIRG